jgi:hypothetical protein
MSRLVGRALVVGFSVTAAARAEVITESNEQSLRWETITPRAETSCAEGDAFAFDPSIPLQPHAYQRSAE